MGQFASESGRPLSPDVVRKAYAYAGSQRAAASQRLAAGIGASAEAGAGARSVLASPLIRKILMR